MRASRTILGTAFASSKQPLRAAAMGKNKKKPATPETALLMPLHPAFKNSTSPIVSKHRLIECFFSYADAENSQS